MTGKRTVELDGEQIEVTEGFYKKATQMCIKNPRTVINLSKDNTMSGEIAKITVAIGKHSGVLPSSMEA